MAGLKIENFLSVVTTNVFGFLGFGAFFFSTLRYRTHEGIFSIPQDSTLQHQSVPVCLTPAEAQTVWRRIMECFRNNELGGDVERSDHG